MPHLTVSLRDVHCTKTEDTGLFGSEDELYITGAIVAGPTSKALLTSILDIDDGQTRSFPPEDSLLFDGDVPDGTTAHLVLEVFDQDSGADWRNRRAVIDGAQAVLDKKLRERRGPGEGAGELSLEEVFQWVADAFQMIAEADKDDRLGELTLDIPLSNSVDIEDYPHAFTANRFASNYSISYRVYKRRDGLSQAEADALWRQKLRLPLGGVGDDSEASQSWHPGYNSGCHGSLHQVRASGSCVSVESVSRTPEVQLSVSAVYLRWSRPKRNRCHLASKAGLGYPTHSYSGCPYGGSPACTLVCSDRRTPLTHCGSVRDQPAQASRNLIVGLPTCSRLVKSRGNHHDQKPQRSAKPMSELRHEGNRLFLR